MEIVVLDGYTLNPGDLSWKQLEAFGNVTVYDRTAFDLENEAKILERIGTAEVIFTNKTPISKSIIDKTSHLKYIGILATGYDAVDIQAATKQGIIVTNIPTYGTQAVAQMTFALLLELCHRVGAHSAEVKAGAWENSKDFSFWSYPLTELQGKTIGIVGFGAIGKAVAKIATAFGMKVLVQTRTIDKSLETESLKFVDLDLLFKESDVISLHCPLLESTKGMINQAAIEKMKQEVMIVNTARGGLIVEADLADALNKQRIAGAAVDVVSVEPIEKDNPLLTAKNCIITPHIAWAAKETRERLLHIAINNLKGFLNDNPKNIVNK